MCGKDPFGNEGSRAQNIQSDVLIAETNRGSSGWWRGVEGVPFEASVSMFESEAAATEVADQQ